MQIDWGWGSDFEFTQQPCEREGWGRLNSDTLPTSHSMSLLNTHRHRHTHTHINTCMLMDKRMGLGQSPQSVSRSVVSCRQWHQPEPTPPLLPLCTAYSKKICFTVVPLFGTFGISALRFVSRAPRCTMDFGFDLISPSAACFQEVGMLILSSDLASQSWMQTRGWSGLILGSAALESWMQTQVRTYQLVSGCLHN